MRTFLSALSGWDATLSRSIALPAQTGGTPLLHFAAHLGDSLLWLGAALIWWGWARRRERETSRPGSLLALLAATSFFSLIVKSLVRRDRPGVAAPMLVGPGPDRHSFPSGHAVRLAAIAVWLGSVHKGLGILGAALVAVVGWSRVRLGIHYVGDVLAGTLLGAAIAAGIGRLVDWLVG